MHTDSFIHSHTHSFILAVCWSVVALALRGLLFLAIFSEILVLLSFTLGVGIGRTAWAWLELHAIRLFTRNRWHLHDANGSGNSTGPCSVDSHGCSDERLAILAENRSAEEAARRRSAARRAAQEAIRARDARAKNRQRQREAERLIAQAECMCTHPP